ncbi:hypothetical protein FIV31_03365 [Coxiella endosymbiont of Ornithodoros amblus]|uniref:hypothetical protein n=1 Tax=Coxiella endosymbiont of Ornithodoros amblus TaxID=1656166 RepID=UPI00244E3482|nr:hypothetical protein [Coxiella endosymbiont of Ornithodoros amblus]MBW5802624.1 hypothetical protein [Coxiella endosymbiont of Ornithodoros amblus]
MHHDELLNALLENKELQKAAAQYENEEHHDIHSLLALGLSPEAKPSPEEILTTGLAQLAERAPKNEPHSQSQHFLGAAFGVTEIAKVMKDHSRKENDLFSHFHKKKLVKRKSRNETYFHERVKN